MDNFWLILAFLSGAFVYHLAMTRNTPESPTQTLKRAYTAITEPKQAEEAVVQAEPTDIDKIMHEITPPNIFERRQAIENKERELEELRKRALEGL